MQSAHTSRTRHRAHADEQSCGDLAGVPRLRGFGFATPPAPLERGAPAGYGDLSLPPAKRRTGNGADAALRRAEQATAHAADEAQDLLPALPVRIQVHHRIV